MLTLITLQKRFRALYEQLFFSPGPTVYIKTKGRPIKSHVVLIFCHDMPKVETQALTPTHPVGLQNNATKDGVFLIQSAIAQWIARWALNPNAECSIPSSHTQSQ